MIGDTLIRACSFYRNLKPLICLATVFFLNSETMATPPFSKSNRFELSYQSLMEINESLSDTQKVFWYSNFKTPSSDRFNLELLTKEQSLGVNLAAILGYEQYKDYNLFGVISGNVTYNSPIISAVISADAYTTQDRIGFPAQDIKFERFIKKDGQKPIEGALDFRFNLPEAYLQSQIKFLTISSGKMKLRWGPGYKGTLGLSGTAYSPFYFYNINLNFGSIIGATAFLCGYDDETFYRKELSFKDVTVVKETKLDLRTNLPRYGAGQRLDLRIGKHVQIGFYELVDFFGSNELIRFANPLQVYYLSNESSGTNNSNLLGGMDFNVLVNRFRFYGEFLNDDITVFEDAGNPNKYAFQLGTAYYGKGPLIQTGFEYTHLARYVYSHSRVLSRHSHWGESMGWPWGNDMDLFTIHAAFNLPYNIRGRTELNYWIKGNGRIEDDWYADGKPDLDHAPYWPQNSKRIVSAILAAEYSPFPWINLNFYYEPVWEEGKLTNGVYSYLQVGIPGNRKLQVR